MSILGQPYSHPRLSASETFQPEGSLQLYSGRALPNEKVPVTVQDTTTNSRLLHRAMQLEMEHVLFHSK